MPVPEGNVMATWFGNLNGALKETYTKRGVTILYPYDALMLQEMGGLRAAQMDSAGRYFVVPLRPNHSQGHTYARSGAGAFPFRGARPGGIARAEVTATNHFHQITVDYETLAKTKGSPDDNSFVNAAEEVMNDLDVGMMTRVEESNMYGGTNLAVFEYNTASNVTVDIGFGSETLLQVNVTYGSWAPYLFVGKSSVTTEGTGAAYDFWELAVDGHSVKRKPTGTVLNNSATVNLADGTTTNAALELAAVSDLATRTLLFRGAAADRTAIINAVNNVAKTVGLAYWGEVGESSRGMEDVLTNGTADDLYGRDPSSDLLWRAHYVSNGDVQLTYSRLMEALNLPISTGMTAANQNGKGGVVVWCSPPTMADLINSEAALLRRAQTGGTAENGFQTVEFDSQVGKVIFKTYPRMKQGQAWVWPKGSWSLVGSQRPELVDWGDGEGRHLRQVENVAARQAAMYGNLGPFLEKPAQCLIIDNIRNSNYA